MNKKTKILLYDIETQPLVMEAWTSWEANALRVVKQWEVLSFAYKWLGDKETKCITREKQATDKQLMHKLHTLMSQADIIVGHNSKSFDDKKVKARMIFHGLQPLPPYKQVDTKLLAKSKFAFTSNSLDNLGEFLGVGRKVKTGGYDLWVQCMAGNPVAWKKMAKYNKQDVQLLERVYLKLAPWTTTPNLATISERPEACPKCGVEGRMQSRGFNYTSTAKYRSYQCQACKGWSSTRVAEKTVKPTYK